MAYLMKCGHVASGHTYDKDGNSKPICAICAGVTSDAEIVERECKGTDGLEGRKAKCLYSSPKRGYTCKGIIPSEWELPFFEYCPDEEYDSYYCGCWGWD